MYGYAEASFLYGLLGMALVIGGVMVVLWLFHRWKGRSRTKKKQMLRMKGERH